MTVCLLRRRKKANKEKGEVDAAEADMDNLETISLE